MGWSEDVGEDDMTTTIWVYTKEDYEQSFTEGAWRSRISAIDALKSAYPNLIWEDSINDAATNDLVAKHRGPTSGFGGPHWGEEYFTLSTMELEDDMRTHEPIGVVIAIAIGFFVVGAIMGYLLAVSH